MRTPSPVRVGLCFRVGALLVGLSVLSGCDSPSDAAGGLQLDLPPANRDWTLPQSATAWDSGMPESIPCNDVPAFSALVMPALVNYCTECHADSRNFKASLSYNLVAYQDPSPEAQGEMCGATRARVKPMDLPGSLLLIQSDPNHPEDHEFKFENPADQAALESAVKNWIIAEEGGVPAAVATGGESGEIPAAGGALPTGGGEVPASGGAAMGGEAAPGGEVPTGGETPAGGPTGSFPAGGAQTGGTSGTAIGPSP